MTVSEIIECLNSKPKISYKEFAELAAYTNGVSLGLRIAGLRTGNPLFNDHTLGAICVNDLLRKNYPKKPFELWFGSFVKLP